MGSGRDLAVGWRRVQDFGEHSGGFPASAKPQIKTSYGEESSASPKPRTSRSGQLLPLDKYGTTALLREGS